MELKAEELMIAEVQSNSVCSIKICTDFKLFVIGLRYI